uniref:Uncharacterized protein n=1 Tax=Arundo donax TaxID=35708 RepID=A0A0A8Y8Y8_ARUDO
MFTASVYILCSNLKLMFPHVSQCHRCFQLFCSFCCRLCSNKHQVHLSRQQQQHSTIRLMGIPYLFSRQA